MQTHHVSFESHHSGATIYIAGTLSELAAIETEDIVRALSEDVFAVRVDLRAVVYIDPDAFVRVARAMRRWRETRRGRIMLEFPERSQPRQASSRVPTGQWSRAPETVRFVLEC
jgi:ABC-type transporter Mla MlaB component